MSDAETNHADDVAHAEHGSGHEHSASEPLGPVDVTTWAYALAGGAVGLVMALAVFLLTGYVIKADRRGPVYGEEAIVGAEADAEEDFVDGKGKVWLEGESWTARSAVPISKGDRVIVTNLDGLTLDVEPVGATSRAQPAT